MNKLIKIGVLGSVCFLANAAFADNATEMVTYFPVPYAAYNNVFVSEKFDVGTKKGSFTLDLGSDNASCSGTSLKAQDVYLRGIEGKPSALSFDNDIYTKNAQFGNTNQTGPVTMEFNKLYIDTLNDKAHAVKDVNAKVWEVQGDMYMIEDAFVAEGAKLPQCEYIVSWKQLNIGGKQGYYLVCGESTDAPSTCPEGQKMYNGNCIYKYSPEEFEVNVLINCHNDSPSTGGTGPACVAQERNYGDIQYYVGGSLPEVPATDSCDKHYASYPWWIGGNKFTFSYQELAWYNNSTQEWCDNVCGSSESCSEYGLLSKNFTYDCPTYKCSGNTYCDNKSGTARAFKCVRQYN